ncbi:MAG: hypothetical protein MJH10_10445 [Epibacterium sp.]|nr:hypothetical protein [Epibacterium sp.]NQX73959.1 hypothetical protein [Epibacterium sp.]
MTDSLKDEVHQLVSSAMEVAWDVGVGNRSVSEGLQVRTQTTDAITNLVLGVKELDKRAARRLVKEDVRAEVMEELANDADQEHQALFKSLGRNPDKYYSKASNVRDWLRSQLSQGEG